ncbi:MAG: ISL3 family transposase [Bacteroidota bacterium]
MEKLKLYAELLNLPSLAILSIEVASKTITVECELKALHHRCPNCGELSFTVHQYYYRTLRDLNMGERYVYLHVKMRQWYCKPCNRYYSESLDFADLNKAFTHRQTDYMFCLARKQSYTEVAAIVDVSPKTIERLVLSTCQKVIDVAARYRLVRRLGIDEHSHRKGKKDYLCILTDLDRGIIIDMLPDRKKETLLAHFKSLGEEFCSKITDVACDYWPTYITVSQTCFPQANIILDRFHVTKWLNTALDTFRKEIRKADPENTHYKKLKWILHKQYNHLSDSQLDNMDLAFANSPTLSKLYWARERFHHILDNATSTQTAQKAMQEWAENLTQQGITQFDAFIKTMQTTKEYIANYVGNYLSNAVTEGLNNLIRSVRRTAFGMTNFQHLRLRVLAISA